MPLDTSDGDLFWNEIHVIGVQGYGFFKEVAYVDNNVCGSNLHKLLFYL
jgi:hypothetical protein